MSESTIARLEQMILAHDEQRHREVAMVLAAMTKRERALVREVAVMANVRAAPAYLFSNERHIERDSVVLADTIARCLDLPDLYPTIARIARRALHPAPGHPTDAPTVSEGNER